MFFVVVVSTPPAAEQQWSGGRKGPGPLHPSSGSFPTPRRCATRLALNAWHQAHHHIHRRWVCTIILHHPPNTKHPAVLCFTTIYKRSVFSFFTLFVCFVHLCIYLTSHTVTWQLSVCRNIVRAVNFQTWNGNKENNEKTHCDRSNSYVYIPETLIIMQTCICIFVMACYPGYSAPGTPTANRFVGLSPRDPAFLHQQQVRHPPDPPQPPHPKHSAHMLLLSFRFLSPISPHIRCEIPALCKKPVTLWICRQL